MNPKQEVNITNELRSRMHLAPERGKLAKAIQGQLELELLSFRQNQSLPGVVTAGEAIYLKPAETKGIYPVLLPKMIVQSGRFQDFTIAIGKAIDEIKAAEPELVNKGFLPLPILVRSVAEGPTRQLGFEIEQKYVVA